MVQSGILQLLFFLPPLPTLPKAVSWGISIGHSLCALHSSPASRCRRRAAHPRAEAAGVGPGNPPPRGHCPAHLDSFPSARGGSTSPKRTSCFTIRWCFLCRDFARGSRMPLLASYRILKAHADASSSFPQIDLHQRKEKKGCAESELKEAESQARWAELELATGVRPHWGLSAVELPLPTGVKSSLLPPPLASAPTPAAAPGPDGFSGLSGSREGSWPGISHLSLLWAVRPIPWGPAEQGSGCGLMLCQLSPCSPRATCWRTWHSRCRSRSLRFQPLAEGSLQSRETASTDFTGCFHHVWVCCCCWWLRMILASHIREKEQIL